MRTQTELTKWAETTQVLCDNDMLVAAEATDLLRGANLEELRKVRVDHEWMVEHREHHAAYEMIAVLIFVRTEEYEKTCLKIKREHKISKRSLAFLTS